MLICLFFVWNPSWLLFSSPIHQSQQNCVKLEKISSKNAKKSIHYFCKLLLKRYAIHSEKWSGCLSALILQYFIMFDKEMCISGFKGMRAKKAVCKCVFRIRGTFDKMTCIHTRDEQNASASLSCLWFLHCGRNTKWFRKIDPNNFFKHNNEQFRTKFEERNKKNDKCI